MRVSSLCTPRDKELEGVLTISTTKKGSFESFCISNVNLMVEWYEIKYLTELSSHIPMVLTNKFYRR